MFSNACICDKYYVRRDINFMIKRHDDHSVACLSPVMKVAALARATDQARARLWWSLPWYTLMNQPKWPTSPARQATRARHMVACVARQ